MLSGMSTIEIIENLKIEKLPKIRWYDGSDDCRRYIHLSMPPPPPLPSPLLAARPVCVPGRGARLWWLRKMVSRRSQEVMSWAVYAKLTVKNFGLDLGAYLGK